MIEPLGDQQSQHGHASRSAPKPKTIAKPKSRPQKRQHEKRQRDETAMKISCPNPNCDGWTWASRKAIIYGHDEIAELLLKSGRTPVSEGI